MGRKYVPIHVGGSEKKIYLDDISKVYKRKIKRAAIPIPAFQETPKQRRLLRKES
jgi:hypothetical protein